mmetsp:Transcript_7120/g.14780  ORF Transcript_7120/g.14780 Transcript_7120/m.14780 type:complete len:252 (+) Transcript_7120:110-865(+)
MPLFTRCKLPFPAALAAKTPCTLQQKTVNRSANGACDSAAWNDQGTSLFDARRQVHRGVLVMLQIRFQSLQVRNGHCANLSSCLAVALEDVVVKHLRAALRVAGFQEVHEGIAHIAQCALVDGQVQKVVGGRKAQIINLLDELALGVAVGDISNHHGGGWALQALLGELSRQIHIFRHLVVSKLHLRPILGRGYGGTPGLLHNGRNLAFFQEHLRGAHGADRPRGASFGHVVHLGGTHLLGLRGHGAHCAA